MQCHSCTVYVLLIHVYSQTVELIYIHGHISIKSIHVYISSGGMMLHARAFYFQAGWPPFHNVIIFLSVNK